MALPLPAKTAGRIAHRPDPDGNTGLWLDKLVYRKLADASNPRRMPQDDDWVLTADARSFALGQLCHRRKVAAGAEALARRREALECEAMVEIRATVNGRLLVDYGRANAMETTVSFHPVWGVPRIPGSALKGVCRAALTHESTPDVMPIERDAIFGTEVDARPARAGQITFYDGLPENGEFELALDVLTPHHSSYYGKEGEDPPGDWESPIPHTFVTVVNTTFVFHLSASHRDFDPSPARLRRLLDVARDGLSSALAFDGVGAKTSAGYGRFTIKRSRDS